LDDGTFREWMIIRKRRNTGKRKAKESRKCGASTFDFHMLPLNDLE